jgi:hypothetical protein
MKYVVLIFSVLALSACLNSPTEVPLATPVVTPIASPSPSASPSASPSPSPSASPSPSPSASPSASPSPSPSPSASPYATSSYGTYECNINNEWVVGGTQCSNDSGSTWTTIALPYGAMNVLVGNQVACAFMSTASSLPTYCSPYTSCDSPVNFTMYCWTPSTSASPVLLNVTSYMGYTPSTRFVGGPLSYYVTNGVYTGEICVNWTVYDNQSGDTDVANEADCGVNVNASGYLQ